MLIEAKAKVEWIIDGKIHKSTETYIFNTETFGDVENRLITILSECITQGTASDYEIQSIKISPIKEIVTQYQGEVSFIASLKDIFTDDNGNEKPLKYKILMWSNSISEAMTNIRQYAQQGYDMQIESLKEVDYIYIQNNNQDGINQD